MVWLAACHGQPTEPFVPAGAALINAVPRATTAGDTIDITVRNVGTTTIEVGCLRHLDRNSGSGWVEVAGTTFDCGLSEMLPGVALPFDWAPPAPVARGIYRIRFDQVADELPDGTGPVFPIAMRVSNAFPLP